MDSLIAPSARLLVLGDRMFGKALDGVNAEQALKRPDDRANSLLWIAAHLVKSRSHMSNLIGLDRTLPWGDLFDRGSELGDQEAYPSIDEVKSAWTELHDCLMKRIEVMTEGDLAASVPIKFPNRDQTRGGAISFFAYHEGYHFGQLSYGRKLLGLAGLTG